MMFKTKERIRIRIALAFTDQTLIKIRNLSTAKKCISVLNWHTLQTMLLPRDSGEKNQSKLKADFNL